MKIRPYEQMVVNGRLTQVGEPFKASKKHYVAVFVCNCGNRIIARVDHVIAGLSTTCGCAKKGINKTHGMTKTPLHNKWCNMIQRCEDVRHTAYPHYGGRGIIVCTRWRTSFQAFMEDMGQVPFPGAEIDRIDNDGNYEPANCKWSTRTEQVRNRRNTLFVEHSDRRITVSEFAERSGLRYSVVRGRLLQGWTVEEIVKTPIGGKRNG